MCPFLQDERYYYLVFSVELWLYNCFFNRPAQHGFGSYNWCPDLALHVGDGKSGIHVFLQEIAVAVVL